MPEQSVENTSSRVLYFPALTGIRAIAAYMVFFHHYTPDLPDALAPIESVISEMHIGVTVFFVLSGFLIYNAYHTAELDSSFVFRYFRNRFARIYPVYFLVVLANTVAAIVLDDESIRLQVSYFFLQVTFIRGFSDQYKFIGVAQAWTLTVEETFYMSFLLMLVCFRYRGFWRYLFVIYSMGALLYWAGESARYGGFFFPLEFVISYTFWGRAGEFFVGMFLARRIIVYYNRHAGSLPRYTSTFRTSFGAMGLLVCLVILALIADLSSVEVTILHPAGMVINNLMVPTFVSVLFLGLIFENTVTRRILSSNMMQLTGKSSYVFYLIHLGVVARLVLNSLSYLPFTIPYSLQILILFVSMNIGSVLLFLLVEAPLNGILRYGKNKGSRMFTNPLSRKEGVSP